MLKIEQTEFWTETSSSRLRSTTARIPSAADDYFLDEDFDVAPSQELNDADVLEAIVVPEEDEAPQLLDVSESIDSIERRRAASEAEARVVEPARAVEPKPERLPAPRPMGTVARKTYAQQDAPKPRFNMTRFLRLTGSLDAVDDRQHWYELPTRGFRAIFTMATRRTRISGDFLKDLRSPPRGVTISKYRRPDEWPTFR